MVDALSRLFGKSSKKVPPSPSSLSSPSTEAFSSSGPNEDDGFTLLGPAKSESPGYPLLPPTDAMPYPPGTRGAAGASSNSNGTLPSQSSVSVPHVLDGVDFKLSGKCSLDDDSSRSQTNAFLDEVSARLDAAQNLIQASNYDFRLEKSVVESDISATMRRMQTY